MTMHGVVTQNYYSEHEMIQDDSKSMKDSEMIVVDMLIYRRSYDEADAISIINQENERETNSIFYPSVKGMFW